jgi:hypothetical protein
MKNLLLFLLIWGFIFSLMLNFFGCATATKVVVVERGKPLPPQPPLELLVYVWNETDYTVEVVLQRPYGGQKKIFVAAGDQLLQPLARGGDYRYFVSASALGMVGEEEGSFRIVPGETRDYRGRIAGYHIVVDRLSWKEKPSRNFFSSGAADGEIRYGSRKDEISGSVKGIKVPAKLELEGGFAFINRILTRR